MELNYQLQATSPEPVGIFLNKPMSISRALSLIALSAVLALTACSEAVDTHPDQPVTKRRPVFKQFAHTFEPIGKVVRDSKDYNPREFKASALALKDLATQPWTYFTPDSNYPPTHAKPAVWLRAPEFKQAQENHNAKVAQLVEAAESGNLEVVRGAVTEVQYSCKTCHNQFRKDY